MADNSYSKIIKNWNNTEPLWEIVRRLKSIQIEEDDAIKVIERYDRKDTLFYVEPPYLAGEKRGRWYKREINETYHRRLGNVLNGIQGMAIMKGVFVDFGEVRGGTGADENGDIDHHIFGDSGT